MLRLWLLAGAGFVAGPAAADTGDDFSNSLFSDLAPLLALFGERVTMQFMSQSTGWADHIAFAMLPLGILTAIVGAIRVGGPSWLKAIIGRAREARAVAEAELMSSTSHEVCELWSGQQVVRVMGEGPIREFIIMVPEGSGEAKRGAPEGASTLMVDRDIPTEEFSDESRYLDEYDPSFRNRLFGHGKQVGKEESGVPPASPSSVAILRNRESQGALNVAPNLTFNVHGRVGRGELYSVATFGVALQIGVLAYYASAVSFPPLRSSLLKNDTAVADYAFPCTALGTILIAAGMLVCSLVVEKSTSEKRYKPKQGIEARLVWLQRAGTANDQAFDAFAIFPERAQALITTSRRVPVWKFSQALTLLGTFFSICGFIVQFVGLRGMHWTTSVTLLGATIVMTVLRVLVRRHLAKAPKSQSLVSGHELDWLALTFAEDSEDIPWLYPLKINRPREGELRESEEPTRSRSPASSENWGRWDGSIAAVVDSAMCGELKSCLDDGSPKPNTSIAHRVTRIRRDIGKLADWHGPASVEAIALARAIEVTMDTLLDRWELTSTVTWSIPVLSLSGNSGSESISLRIERQEDGNWKAFSDEIEAVLSLWLYSTYALENPREDQQHETRIHASRDDAWLRAKGTPARPSLRLLGSPTTTLRQDFEWWMHSGGTGRIARLQPDSISIKERIQPHRVVGFSSTPTPHTDTNEYLQRELWRTYGPRGNVQLAVESYVPLKDLYAQHIFSAFMWAVAKTMRDPIADGADVRPTKSDAVTSDSAWQSFTLHNSNLSKMAQDVKDTGLGDLDDIYLAIIPPLSAEARLPRIDAIVEWTQQHAMPLERSENWSKAADAYLWLFRTMKDLGRSETTVKATALLMDFSKAVSTALEQRKAQYFHPGDIDDLNYVQSMLDVEWRKARTDIAASVRGLYALQDREFYPKGRIWPLESKNMELGLTDSHWFAYKCSLTEGGEVPITFSVEDEDVLGWTPLHYAAARINQYPLDYCLHWRADVNAQDNRGRTPLHYACRINYEKPRIAQSLLRHRADVNIQDVNGLAPMHVAVMSGYPDALISLIEAGAEIDIADSFGRTPLFWAAFKGRRDMVALLGAANMALRDYNGRTALHLAAMAETVAENATDGPVDVVRYLIEDAKADKEAKEKWGWRPLHFAARAGKEVLVRYLVEEAKVDKGAKNNMGRTPLHLAAESGQKAIVKYLIEDAEVDKEVKDNHAWTPLHVATEEGHEHVVRYLVEDAKANKDAKDQDGQTPLDIALDSAASTEAIVQLLK